MRKTHYERKDHEHQACAAEPTARYGTALGALAYVLWRGIVRFFVPENFDPRRLRGWRGSR